MISDEDRAKIGELAMEAIDAIEELYGEDAELEDAVLLLEVSRPNEDGRCTEIVSRTTTHRVSVAAGIAQMYASIEWGNYGEAQEED